MPRMPEDCGSKTCEYCNRSFDRRRFGTRIEDIGAFRRRRFCSRRCMANSMVKGASRTQRTTRHQAQKIKGSGPCESCGDPGAHVHHKDRNPGNNSPANLSRLCLPCHRKAHRIAVQCKHCGDESGRIVQGYCLKHYARFHKWGHPAMVKRNQNTALEIVKD